MADCMTGEIQIFAFNYAPYEWAPCNGQLIPIQQNTALYSLLGINFGGTANQTFGLPNLQSRVAIGQGVLQNTNVPATYTVGQTGGNEKITLTTGQIPAHTHALLGIGNSLLVSDAPATQPAPTATVNTLGAFNEVNYTNSVYTSQAPTIPLNTGTAFSGGTVETAGGGDPFSIAQPTLGLNYCICLYGDYPTRAN